ncbi:hypothetical protein SAMN05192532_101768 [Alteribacillus iranensis]|uniref:Uncharacterized protein n=1 Tax=Alteribacillus iranensis TaxID=930128 RepID=A0A1I2AE45_9BACI|nr:hypothetical protein SAMN05192532_101768 [Alteribacillus iranensis]
MDLGIKKSPEETIQDRSLNNMESPAPRPVHRTTKEILRSHISTYRMLLSFVARCLRKVESLQLKNLFLSLPSNILDTLPLTPHG